MGNIKMSCKRFSSSSTAVTGSVVMRLLVTNSEVMGLLITSSVVMGLLVTGFSSNGMNYNKWIITGYVNILT